MTWYCFHCLHTYLPSKPRLQFFQENWHRILITPIWGNSKNNGFSPNHPSLIGFSIIFTIHFPYFWKHPYLASCGLRMFYNNLAPARSPSQQPQQSSSFLSSVSRFMMYQARLSSWIPKHRKTTVVERRIATKNEIRGSGKFSCQKQQTLFGFPPKNQTTNSQKLEDLRKVNVQSPLLLSRHPK